MAAMWMAAQADGGADGWEGARLGAMLAVHTTVANPFVIALLVLVIASVVVLRRRGRR